MKNISLHPDDKVCILRSAQLGDWMVTIPFICYLIYSCKIKKENIYTLIINSNGFNPLKLILGEQSILFKNSFCLNTKNSFSLLKSIITTNKDIPNNVKALCYLPFSYESRVSVFKKKVLSYCLLKIKNRFGFEKKNKETEDSQYFSYFQRLGIFNIPNKNLIRRFLIEEEIITKKIKNVSNKIAIYPHSKLKMKVWQLDNFSRVIEYILNSSEKKIYLIGGKDDIEYNSVLISKFKDNNRVINIAGNLSIPKTLDFLNECDMLIGNDGAPLHMASLVNTPVIGLYTYKEPIFSWEPILSDKFITYRANVICKHCFKDSCSNPICLTNIDYKQVISGIQELMSETLIALQEVKIIQTGLGLSHKSIQNV